MQRLYENYKILTYPRTDSRYVTTDIIDTIPDRLKAISINPYTKLASKAKNMPISAKSAFVDNAKVSDHHAIIPTEETVMLSKLSDSERKIYDLVVKRFLSVLFPPFEYEQTTIKVKIGEQNFIAKGKVVINNGWKEVYENNYEDEDKNEEIKEQLLPKLNKGEEIKILSVSQTTGETKPPAPFNEATLLSAMENPIKYMDTDDKALLKTIGETGGLGTVATRADIIEKLFNSFVVEKKGKDIFITAKGKQLLELAPEELKEPKLTAQWELKLTQIAKGELKKEKFMEDIRAYAQSAVKEIKDSSEKFRHDNMTRTKCPECGKFMLEVEGKKGRMLVCQDRECGYRKPLAIVTNARCPQCHKKLELVGEGEGRMFICKCGYREKLSVFEARKKNETPALSKKDVQKFIKQQDKKDDEPMNTALSDALSKLKF
jgi:DNA topoisomerase-3